MSVVNFKAILLSLSLWNISLFSSDVIQGE